MKKLKILTLLTVFVCLLAILNIQGQTRGWGFNNNGALGIGNTTNQPTPQTVASLPDATGASGGIDHSLFLRPNGTLAVAGRNDYAQLATDGTTGSSSPLPVPFLTNVVQASAGGFHSAALLANGTVWLWGFNNEGQIGNGTTTTTGCQCVVTPTQALISEVVQVEAGSFHTLALKSNGTVWGWGVNTSGQLGDGSVADRSVPVQVGIGVPGFTNIIAVSAGDNHSLALKSDGSVWVWGSNEYGQIGNGTTSMIPQRSPVQNTTLSGITQIAAGIFHSMALNKSGKVFVWGDNLYGQVGNGTPDNFPQTTPVQNTSLNDVMEIDTAGFTNYARLLDGVVTGWGLNDVGQIGNGTTTATGCQCQPTPTIATAGGGNAGISSGWFHAFALKPVIPAAAGTGQTFQGDNVQLSFANITSPGNIAYTAVIPFVVAGSYNVPLGYTIQTNQPAYEVTTTAATSGDIDVCIAGLKEFSPTAFAGLRILHGEGVNWVDRTNSTNFIRRQICARVTTLSPFVIATAPGPTAANVSVSGRVVSGKSGISRAIVSVTDASGTTRTARASSFGYYRFEGLPAGQTYTFTVTAKGYEFAPQIVTLNESLADFDFSAIE
jgi:alpha-tubulin suppressor-like RCC1 family protein